MAADHSCLVYERPSALAATAVAFLAEGLAHGEQVGYFGWSPRDELRARLRELGDLDDLTRRGALVVASLDEHYRRDEVPDPHGRLGFWSEATDRSRAAGFTALRVVADTTAWLALPPPREACSCAARG